MRWDRMREPTGHKRRGRSASTSVRVAAAVIAGIALMLAGCGGGKSGSTGTRAASGARTAAVTSPTVWAQRTQALCQQKRAAVAALGYVHITYGGIARVGLPAVKRSLDAYLGRLLSVLREFSARQRLIPAPASVAGLMNEARALDESSQAVTADLRRALGGVRSASALSAAFRAWGARTAELAARGDALARHLHLRGCLATS